jgi:type IV pilus assembly protein PilB
MFNSQQFQQSAQTRFISFLNLLVGENIIKSEELTAIRGRFSSAEQLYDALEALGNIDGLTLAKSYASSAGLPFIVLNTISPQAKELIDENLAKSFGFIPFEIDEVGKVLQIAITDPVKLGSLNSEAITELENKLGYKIELFIAPQDKAAEKSSSGPNKDVPEIDLSTIEISDKDRKRIPFDLASKYKMVIFRKQSEGLFDVAVVNPADPKVTEILEYLNREGGIKLNVYKSSPEQIDRALGGYISSPETTKPNIPVPKPINENRLPSEIQNDEPKTDEEVLENPDLGSFLNKQLISVKDLQIYANSGQVPQLLSAILLMAAAERSSDVHIEPFEKNTRLRFRIDGELNDVLLLPFALNPSIVARVKILSKLKLDEQRIPQDGRFEVVAGGEDIDIRVSTLPTIFGEKVELRLLSKSKKVESLEDLGVTGLAYDRILEAVSQPNGVILSTGPTGSGKTTTLYSLLSRLNRPEVNIVTLEDPVEYEINGINQTQIKPQIGFGFADGLRSILRQDPNIIMVGEIRDSATAELVTHAALTGHLVLSTLHTNDASSALPRLINLGVEPFLLSSAINAIMAQRLVRRICSECKEEIEVPQSVIQEVTQELQNLNVNLPLKFYKGKGCPKCKGGFKGRIGIFEVYKMTEAIENLVLAKKSSQDILNEALKEGMITMKQDGLIKALKGVTTVDEVLRVTSQAKE